MATVLEISLVEKQVMDVFKRCTGFFDHIPKRNTERTIDMVWHGVLATGLDYSRQDVMAAIENLLSAGMLYMDEHTGHLTLTDDGYAFVCRDFDA